MRQSEINTSAQLGSIPQPGLANPDVKKEIQQSQRLTEFPPGPKSWLNDKRLPHGTLLGKTSEGVGRLFQRLGELSCSRTLPYGRHCHRFALAVC